MKRQKAQTIDISPSILKWARSESGLSVNELLSRFNKNRPTINEEQYNNIENTGKVTIPILKKLAYYIYDRPIATFLLNKPPGSLFDELPKFRSYTPTEKPSPEVLEIIKKIENKLNLILPFYENKTWGLSSKKLALDGSLDDMAVELRRLIELPLREQFSWKSHNTALKELIKRVETLGIFVFQFKMPINMIRGFSTFYGQKIPVIVLNSDEIVQARIFTLFHELYHLIKDVSSACFETEISAEKINTVENDCNKFSASFLMPKDDLIKIGNKNIPRLATMFKVSKQAMYIRLRDLNLVNFDDMYYQKIRTNYQKPKGGGAGKKGESNVANRITNKYGNAFPKEVFALTTSNKLTEIKAAKCLDTSIKIISKLVV